MKCELQRGIWAGFPFPPPFTATVPTLNLPYGPPTPSAIALSSMNTRIEFYEPDNEPSHHRPVLGPSDGDIVLHNH